MTSRAPSRGEAAAWKQLRLLRHEGFAFRREHSIGAYRADFMCLRRRLIVEVDGGVHDLPGAAERDAARDAWLGAEGYKVLRFRDSEILSEANWLDEVRSALRSQAEAGYRLKGSMLRAQRASLPLEGGGQGGGEGVERELCSEHAPAQSLNVEAHFTPPPTPSPSRGGG